MLIPTLKGTRLWFVASLPRLSMAIFACSMKLSRGLLGASGMVGGYALRYMLDHPTIERVTAIGEIEHS